MWTPRRIGLPFADMAAKTPPDEALELRETITLAETLSSDTIFDDDKAVPLHIIRPGVGKGKGHHLYEADMLKQNADKFAGWKMYVDHESAEARKAAGGLPRKARDLGGRILESWWDPTVPADPDRGYGAGAVVGRARPVKWIREQIEDDPELLEASIAASATGVRPMVQNGKRVWLVEGIDDRGSVDWVTEGGAGGRIAALLEAYAEDDEADDDLLEAMSNDDLKSYIEENRPELAVAEAESRDNDNPEGGADMAEITPEALQEALAENPEVLVGALAQSAEAQVFVTTLVEAQMEEGAEAIRAEAKAEAHREIELRDMRDDAHKQINESKLPETWQASLRAEFDLVEGTATDALDQEDETDDDGKVTKKAKEKLSEAVEARIATERERLAEVSPTRVRKQGPAADSERSKELKEGEKPDEKKTEPKIGEGTMWRDLMEGAGVDVDRAYALDE